MTDYRVNRYRWALIIVTVLSLAVHIIGGFVEDARRRKAYEAGAANGFIRGACYELRVLDPPLAARMAEECNGAETRHLERLANGR